ncbi:MAG: hypothetical protein GX962_08115 [Epulopiscium sp.]|nr:hypothetical protein [Candidatus Epulonipiscium sp.]
MKQKSDNQQGSILIWILLWSSISIFVSITVLSISMGHVKRIADDQKTKTAFYVAEGLFTYSYAQLSEVLVEAIQAGYEQADQEVRRVLEEERERKNQELERQRQLQTVDDTDIDPREEISIERLVGAMADISEIIQEEFIKGYHLYFTEWLLYSPQRNTRLILQDDSFWSTYISYLSRSVTLRDVQIYPKEQIKIACFRMEAKIQIDQTVNILICDYDILKPIVEFPYTLEWRMKEVEGEEFYEFEFSLPYELEEFTPYRQWIQMKVGYGDER